MSESDQHRRTSADGPARVDVLGVGISCLTLDSAVEEVSGWVDRGEHRYVCVTGVHGVMECRRDQQLLQIHNRSGLTTPDGMPMVWSAHWAGRREVRRVYGPDLMAAVLARAVDRGWSSFLYGGGPGTAELLAHRLTARFPGLRIAGTWTPPFRPLTPEEDAEVVRMINDSGARLVWVGLSTPKQERWMADHVGKLRANALFGVGAAFDLHAGTAPAGTPLDAAQRAGMGLPAGPGTAAAVAPLPAEQPGLRPGHPGPPTEAGPVHPRTGRHGRVRHHGGSTEMSVTAQRSDVRPTLSIGDVVEVKPAEEILAGLDERGELDSLPFMPEMLQFCGRRFVVDKIAFKTCDTATWTGLRRLTDTVHLAGVRCDGRGTRRLPGGLPDLLEDRLAHPRLRAGQDGRRTAAAACRNASVLETAEAGPAPRLPTKRHRRRGAPAAPGSGSPRWPTARAARGRAASDEPVYSCQATELTRAAPVGIPLWDLTQYVQDVRSGNAPARQVLRGIAIGAFNRMQDLTRQRLPERFRIRGGQRYPFIRGTADRTPVESLGLQPGEWVRVKSLEEIRATLNADNLNRGMSFDREMLRYCGRTAQVLRRVERIIDESTGRMQTMKTPCIVLADVVCTSDYHRSCPRSVYAYWREIWLERVPAPLTASRAAGDNP